MISFRQRGSFKNFYQFSRKMSKLEIRSVLERYARQGVNALSAATPIESGLTATSWDYKIVNSGRSWSIYWTNSHVESGVPIAIILQYGHGTGTGGYIQGRDYINPAIKPIFDAIANGVWKEVTSA